MKLASFLTVAVASAFAISAQAALVLTQVTANNSGVVINSIPQAGTPGVGQTGYDIFGAKGTPTTTQYTHTTDDVKSLPSYLSVTTSTNDRYLDATNLNSQLTINGTVYTTADLVSGNNQYATITLLAGAPSSFRIGALVNNAKANSELSWDVTFSTTGSATQSMVIMNQQYRHGVNDFYFVDVTGAVAGDTIKIANSRLGGIVFDAVAVPEPAAMGLMGVAMAGLLARRRHS